MFGNIIIVYTKLSRSWAICWPVRAAVTTTSLQQNLSNLINQFFNKGGTSIYCRIAHIANIVQLLQQPLWANAIHGAADLNKSIIGL